MLLRTPRDLAAAMRERRRTLGWNQQQLADRVGVTRQWIGAMEKGKPSAELGLVLRALASLGLQLHVAPEKLRGGPSLLDAVIQQARGKKA